MHSLASLLQQRKQRVQQSAQQRQGTCSSSATRFVLVMAERRETTAYAARKTRSRHESTNGRPDK